MVFADQKLSIISVKLALFTTVTAASSTDGLSSDNTSAHETKLKLFFGFIIKSNNTVINTITHIFILPEKVRKLLVVHV